MKNEQIIMKTVFGSKLYGLDNNKSDSDYIGIYLPTLDELLLNTYKPYVFNNTDKGKNNENSVDEQFIALPTFIKLCCKNETVALDVLHSTVAEYDCTGNGAIWVSLQNNRHKFLTKNMKAHIGFISGQVKRFNRKGEKLKVIRDLIVLLKTFNPESRLSENWDELPTGKYIEKGVFDHNTKFTNNSKYWDIFGSKYQENITIKYCIEQLQLREHSYGKRTKKTEVTDYIDYKSVSHGFRVAYQLLDLYTKGYFTYPLAQTEFLKDVKGAKYNYHTELADKLEGLIQEIFSVAKTTDYPEKVDSEYWDNWLLDVYKLELIDNKEMI